MKIHKFAQAVPEMTEKEFADLKADIKANGQKVPIILFEDQVLDGRHRYNACKELKITPKTVAFKGSEVEAAHLVISLNIFRRHLTNGQRTVITMETLMPALKKAAKEKIITTLKSNKGNQHTGNVGKFTQPTKSSEPAIVVRDEVAKAAKVSPKTVSMVNYIKEHGDEDSIKALKEGSSVNSVYKQVKHKVEGGKPKIIKKEEPKVSAEVAAAQAQKEHNASIIAHAEVLMDLLSKTNKPTSKTLAKLNELKEELLAYLKNNKE
jgi:Tfp pilus assembly major pilin PilA